MIGISWEAAVLQSGFELPETQPDEGAWSAERVRRVVVAVTSSGGDRCDESTAGGSPGDAVTPASREDRPAKALRGAPR